jgi:hypothetical protein
MGVGAVMEIAELTSSGDLRLPPGILERFRVADRFVVWAEGDGLYLKRITKRSVTELVGEAPEGEPLPLDEINDIVHEVRRKRRSR